MNDTQPEEYLADGPFADPGAFRPLLSAIARELGPDPRALAARVRGLMVHVFWRWAYGLPKDEPRAEPELNIRDLRGKLELIAASQAALGRDRSSVEPLPAERKLIGNCRDFSLLFAALLREAGIPARARCGFGMYFMPDHGEDHWVVERWDAAAGRWVVSDPQLDEIMIGKLALSFDAMDLPDGAFLSGGEAWLACREGLAKPERFGIFDMSGWDFIKGDFVRDIASLAGLELLPWDLWGVMALPFETLSPADLGALDAAARRTAMRSPIARGEARSLLADPRFALPRRIATYLKGSQEEVDLGPILGIDWPHGKSDAGGPGL